MTILCFVAAGSNESVYSIKGVLILGVVGFCYLLVNGFNIKFWKMNYLSKITHINCSSSFLKDPKNVALLKKMVKAAYHMKLKKKKKC